MASPPLDSPLAESQASDLATANPEVGEVTGLLRLWAGGNQDAGAAAVTRLYHELRQVASREMDREGNASVQATDLVHEAYLRLHRDPGDGWRDRSHFCAACGRLIRQILVDRARARTRQKRGGGRPDQLRDEAAPSIQPAVTPDLIALDSVLQELASVDEVAMDIVTLRFFSGLTIDETASGLGLGRATVVRKWRIAQAWLQDALAVAP